MQGLVIEGLSHAFDGVVVVRALSLAVAPGEIVCLLGPSGSGKSTVLRLVAGLETVQRGRILIDGAAVADAGFSRPPEARHVGLMFQDFTLFPHLNAIDNVGFGLSFMPKSERRQRAQAMLANVGMTWAALKFPHMLSGGEQQRIALARALAPNPSVMLLDEPFSGLDVTLRERIRRDTQLVLKETGTPTLMVTHDPEEAMLMADRIALVRAGSLVQIGAPMALYRHPLDAFCASFLGDTNRLHGRVHAGMAETALGALAAPGHQEGAQVEVLIRPEGLRLSQTRGNGQVSARVLSARGLGPQALVRLRLAAGEEVTARIDADQVPEPAEEVGVAVNPAMVFVFPAEDR
jgi:iron(III) transport system ATP-binding protein